MTAGPMGLAFMDPKIYSSILTVFSDLVSAFTNIEVINIEMMIKK
jgi:hypothetical protein